MKNQIYSLNILLLITFLSFHSLADNLPNQIVWNKDGAEMAYVPAGSFEMGDHFDEGEDNELPVHTVTLDGFYMDKTEVTVGQFKVFLDDTSYSWGGDWDSVASKSPTDDHPMIWVTWNDATAYAEWAGKRLPTEAEWEYAARGGQGQRYSRGNDIDDTEANYGGNVGKTTLVGNYPANGYSLYDMTGNVYEWCVDWYDENYYTSQLVINPVGPENGSKRVLRGGAWRQTNSNTFRLAYRNNSNPSNTNNRFGFRCVSSPNITADSFSNLLPSDDQIGINWFSGLSLIATDYTWATANSSSATLSVRLFVQPLGGVDASSWDFSTVTTVDGLVVQLDSDGLNLVEATDYQLLVVGQDNNGTVDITDDDVVETLEILLSDLDTEPEVIENPPTQIVWNQDGAEMALIPAGSFEMGDHFGEGAAHWGELPVHAVTLDGFYMDKTEVTVGQFKAFLADSGYDWGGQHYDWNSVDQRSPSDNHPMVYVSWHDATAYAKWAGKRLPTEAEWEYAARGGMVGSRYPWGNEITHDDANWGNTVNGKDKWAYCSPVASFKENQYGLYDMTGNVWEWCADWYGFDYYSKSPAKNPRGPDKPDRATGRVLRGGSWYSVSRGRRVASRDAYGSPNDRKNDIGFRCVSGLR